MFENSGYRQRLDRLLNGGRLFHAYVITGRGREEFAARMAAALVCEGEGKPCGRCPHCKKTAQNIHPDIVTLTFLEDKKEILVDQIRQLRADVYVRPNEAARKVYIIDPADGMNANAQNAFLKVLEEGPAYASFLLVTGQPGGLLPTVRSRCGEVFLHEETAPTVSDPRAEELAGLLLAGEEKALHEFCVSAEMEKRNREELTLLFNQTGLALGKMLEGDPSLAGRIGPRLDLLRTLQEAADFNAGTGHLLGWLCAASFQ